MNLKYFPSLILLIKKTIILTHLGCRPNNTQARVTAGKEAIGVDLSSVSPQHHASDTVFMWIFPTDGNGHLKLCMYVASFSLTAERSMLLPLPPFLVSDLPDRENNASFKKLISEYALKKMWGPVSQFHSPFFSFRANGTISSWMSNGITASLKSPTLSTST